MHNACHPYLIDFYHLSNFECALIGHPALQEAAGAHSRGGKLE
jgi:hypothetical protein